MFYLFIFKWSLQHFRAVQRKTRLPQHASFLFFSFWPHAGGENFAMLTAENKLVPGCQSTSSAVWRAACTPSESRLAVWLQVDYWERPSGFCTCTCFFIFCAFDFPHAFLPHPASISTISLLLFNFVSSLLPQPTEPYRPSFFFNHSPAFAAPHRSIHPSSLLFDRVCVLFLSRWHRVSSQGTSSGCAWCLPWVLPPVTSLQASTPAKLQPAHAPAFL